METEFNINELSNDVDLSISTLKEILGIPITEECKSATYDEAKKVFDDTDNNSELHELAARKMVELASIESRKEALKLFFLTPEGSKAERLAIHKLALFYGWNGSI